MPRATEHIEGIIGITGGLIDRGFAYASGGDVYFDVTKAAEYGKLSHRKPEELQAGARIDPSEKKRHPGDFALWKASKPGEPSWESPWGPGRPGWHIECSAMSMKLLGEHFDIHGGGLDLVFPHHENEVVQSESYSGKPFATYWLHNGLLTKEGKKISKSDPGTLVLMGDLLAKYPPDTIRALLLSSHYRRPIDYSNDRLDELNRGLQAFRTFFGRFRRITGQAFDELAAPARREAFDGSGSELLGEVGEHRERFLDAMDDDFNTGGAMGELYELLRTLNRFADARGLETPGADAGLIDEFRRGTLALRELTGILGLFRRPEPAATAGDDGLTGPLMDLVIELRAELRKQKNFGLSDLIRDRLGAIGLKLEDRPGQTTWRREG
jgi:cysteinyl-tRNA synthetase